MCGQSCSAARGCCRAARGLARPAARRSLGCERAGRSDSGLSPLDGHGCSRWAAAVAHRCMLQPWRHKAVRPGRCQVTARVRDLPISAAWPRCRRLAPGRAGTPLRQRSAATVSRSRPGRRARRELDRQGRAQAARRHHQQRGEPAVKGTSQTTDDGGGGLACQSSSLPSPRSSQDCLEWPRVTWHQPE